MSYYFNVNSNFNAYSKKYYRDIASFKPPLPYQGGLSWLFNRALVDTAALAGGAAEVAQRSWQAYKGIRPEVFTSEEILNFPKFLKQFKKERGELLNALDQSWNRFGERKHLVNQIRERVNNASQRGLTAVYEKLYPGASDLKMIRRNQSLDMARKNLLDEISPYDNPSLRWRDLDVNTLRAINNDLKYLQGNNL